MFHVCVAPRGTDDPHRRRQAAGADELHADCRFFTGRGDSDKQPTITALVMLDRASGDMTSTVTDKDVVVHMSQVLRASLWEHVHVTMRHDTNVRWSHRESQPRSCVSGSRPETICRVLLKQHEWHSNLVSSRIASNLVRDSADGEGEHDSGTHSRSTGGGVEVPQPSVDTAGDDTDTTATEGEPQLTPRQKIFCDRSQGAVVQTLLVMRQMSHGCGVKTNA